VVRGGGLMQQGGPMQQGGVIPWLLFVHVLNAWWNQVIFSKAMYLLLLYIKSKSTILQLMPRNHVLQLQLQSTGTT
jgi:hypothetical protein